MNVQIISIHLPIINNHLFQPSIVDKGFQIWQDKGIRSMWYLYIDNTFASFEQLSQKFGLTGIHSFRYLQIRDFVRKSFVNFPLIPKLNCLDTLLFVNTAKKGRVSMIYSTMKLWTVVIPLLNMLEDIGRMNWGLPYQMRNGIWPYLGSIPHLHVHDMHWYNSR